MPRSHRYIADVPYGICTARRDCGRPLSRKSMYLCDDHLAREGARKLKLRKTGKPKERLIEFKGEIRNLKDWAAHLNTTVPSLRWRLEKWGVERALSTVGIMKEWTRKLPSDAGPGYEEAKMPERFTGEHCVHCGLRGEHVCTPPASWYAQFRAQATGDASTGNTRKGAGWK